MLAVRDGGVCACVCVTYYGDVRPHEIFRSSGASLFHRGGRHCRRLGRADQRVRPEVVLVPDRELHPQALALPLLRGEELGHRGDPLHRRSTLKVFCGSGVSVCPARSFEQSKIAEEMK